MQGVQGMHQEQHACFTFACDCEIVPFAAKFTVKVLSLLAREREDVHYHRRARAVRGQGPDPARPCAPVPGNAGR